MNNMHCRSHSFSLLQGAYLYFISEWSVGMSSQYSTVPTQQMAYPHLFSLRKWLVNKQTRLLSFLLSQVSLTLRKPRHRVLWWSSGWESSSTRRLHGFDPVLRQLLKPEHPRTCAPQLDKARVPQWRAGTAPTTTKRRAEARLSVQAVCMQSPRAAVCQSAL